MKRERALQILDGTRRGSSRPIIVETDGGRRIVKLRGVPQGAGTLVAEVIVAELAESLGLSVPPRSLVELDSNAPVPGGDDELDDVMHASGGANLGFEYLYPAHDLSAGDVRTISADDQVAILWLDRFVMNPDRTARNPNLMRARDGTWLIDHGAALGFQYDWEAVTEHSPSKPPVEYEPHLFASTVSSDDLLGWDELFAARLTRDAIDAAVAEVPDEFLRPLIVGQTDDGGIRRRRAAYGAFLWKRLANPRGFLTAVTPARASGRRSAIGRAG